MKRFNRVLEQAARKARNMRCEVLVISRKDRRRLFHARCAECGGPGQQLDHVIPLRRGGRHAVGNFQRLCDPCNRTKSSRLLIEWRNGRSAPRR